LYIQELNFLIQKVCTEDTQDSSDHRVLDMSSLPEDVQWYIWRIYVKEHLARDLINSYEFIWHEPSDRLKSLMAPDKGAIQHGAHELTDMIEDEDMWVYRNCVGEKCENCSHYGFPCLNLAYYGFRNEKIAGMFQANF